MRIIVAHLSRGLWLPCSVLIASLIVGCLQAPPEALPTLSPTEQPTAPPTATLPPPTATALALNCPPLDVTDTQWSPDGSRLAITRKADIVIADLRTNTLTTLVSLPGIEVYGAQWSPDGKKILFMYVKEYLGPAALYVADAETGEFALLNSLWGTGYAWSPDSSRIAFSYGGLYVTEVGVTTKRVFSGAVGNPVWSPDGSQIAFAYDPEGVEAFDMLAVASANGRNLRTLAESSRTITNIAWSPDGQHIAFVNNAFEEGVDSSVNVADADGTGFTELAVDPLTIAELAWSADGESVLYYSWQYWFDEKPDLYIYSIGLDGSPPEILLTMQHDPQEIAFSPDRTRIAYVVWEREAQNSLYIAGLDGSGVYPLIDGSHCP